MGYDPEMCIHEHACCKKVNWAPRLMSLVVVFDVLVNAAAGAQNYTFASLQILSACFLLYSDWRKVISCAALTTIFSLRPWLTSHASPCVLHSVTVSGLLLLIISLFTPRGSLYFLDMVARVCTMALFFAELVVSKYDVLAHILTPFQTASMIAGLLLISQGSSKKVYVDVDTMKLA